MSSARRQRSEPDAPPPMDLRLALPALAAWGGCLVGLWPPAAAGWVCAGVAIALVGCGVVAWWDRRRVAGLVASLACLGAATGIAALTLTTSANDPLVVAARSGQWGEVAVTISAAPVPVHSRFGAHNGGAGAESGGAAVSDGAAVSGGGTGSSQEPTAATRWRLTGTADSARINGATVPSQASVTIFATGAGWASVMTGQTVRAVGTLQPDTFHTIPGVTLRARGEPTMVSDAPWWQRWATSARRSLSRSANTLSPDMAGLLRGIVVGDTRGIGPELSADAKISGLTHLTAVSGTHMAIVSGALVLMLRRFGPRVAAIGVCAGLTGMVLLVGPAPSVLRSAVMGLIGVAAVIAGRSRTALPALSAAVLLLELFDPALATDVGFALSVQATAGLVILGPPWIAALRRRGVPRGWATVIVLPVVAHLMTMPVIAAISGRVSLVAVPANILVTPVVAPALLLGLGCLLASVLWAPAGLWFATINTPFLWWITKIAHTLARWPSATVPWPASTTGVLTLALLTVAGLMALRHRRVRALAAAATAGAVLVLVPAHLAHVGWPARGWLLTACEVGQGDGMVLSTGTPGAAVVVDTGPDPRLMDGCLDRLGITRVPLVILTHLHADHIDGLAGVLRARRVGAVVLGPGRALPAAYDTVAGLAHARDIPLIEAHPGVSWQVGDLILTVLGPRHLFHATDSDPNNNSVVLRATHHGVRMLMTGDIERPAQRALLRSGVDLRADVLKQPHHGSSKLLPRFVAAVDPTIAVIGVGAHNDYGHPSASALRTDRAAGVTTILRTDRVGDAQVCWTAQGIATATRGAHLSRLLGAAS